MFEGEEGGRRTNSQMNGGKGRTSGKFLAQEVGHNIRKPTGNLGGGQKEFLTTSSERELERESL